MDKGKLVIGYNNTSLSSEPCSICTGEAGRRRGGSRVPLEVFDARSYGIICPSCVDTHAPELAQALNAYYDTGGDASWCRGS